MRARLLSRDTCIRPGRFRATSLVVAVELHQSVNKMFELDHQIVDWRRHALGRLVSCDRDADSAVT
jgi:hypothetical protein